MPTETDTPTPAPYPARLQIDYPDRALNRLTTFFRPLVVVPIAIVLGLVAGGSPTVQIGSAGDAATTSGGGAALVVLPVALMVLFRRRYPRWWFDWNVELLRFATRVSSYVLLMSDTYPSTEDEQWVHLDIDYPDAERDLNRWMPLVKWLLAIPHFIVLLFLELAAFVMVVVAWFAILLTGRYPRGIFEFVAGVARWNLRVTAYAVLLTTDRYPPFSLKEER